MLDLVHVVLSLALTQGATQPAAAPPAATQPAPSAQPAPVAQPGQPTQAAPPAQPGQAYPPWQPDQTSPPAQPGQAYPPAQPGQAYPPAQPGQAYPPAQPGQAYPPAQPGQAYPPAQPGQAYPPPGYYPYPYPYPYPPPASAPATAQEPVKVEVPTSVSHRRLVFANTYALNFGLFPIPSGDFSFFLGTNLRPRKSMNGHDWNTALGYTLTLSVGGADIVHLDQFGNGWGIFVHRHHFTAMGFGGARQRLFYSMGGGGFFSFSSLVGLEGEGKLGYVFSAKEGRRSKGIVGGQVRLSGPFEGFPSPQFGAFVGFMVF